MRGVGKRFFTHCLLIIDREGKSYEVGLVAYLDARRSAPYPDPRLIGNERALFELYLLQGGSLAGCVGKAEAAVAVASRRDELEQVLKAKWEHDQYSGLLEVR